jgi:hypothetical protein
MAAIGMLVVPAYAGAKLTADYNFNGNFNNSAGPAGDLHKVGPGGSFKNVQVFGDSQRVWEWPEATGLRLNNANKAVGGNGGHYTFVLLLRLDATSGYRKLVDFDNRQSDEGWYEYYKSLYPYDLSNFDYDKERVHPGKWCQIALTRNGKGKVHGYVGDALIGHAGDPGKDEALGPDKILHFLIDDSGGEESGGQIARLRIYDEALSSNKVKHLGH